MPTSSSSLENLASSAAEVAWDGVRFTPVWHDDQVVLRLFEGKNRQVRAMLLSRAAQTLALHRTCFGGVGLNGLGQPGSWAALTPQELQLLRSLCVESQEPSD